jgi:hypothetical protein
MGKSTSLRFWVSIPVLSGALAVGGCAATRVPAAPTVALARADTAVQQAEASKAPLYAPSELRSAREKLLSAHAAMDGADYDRARHLAEQAAVDAQLAQVRGEAGDAQHDADELRRTVDALRAEAVRPMIP